MEAVIRYSSDVLPVSREKILALEDAIRAELPPVECPVTHHFSDGVYGREMFIPAGTCITGKIHKRPHLFMVLSGELSVLTERGMERLTGPVILQGQPGIKRAAFAHTDVRCIAIHGTHETDVEKIEAEFIAQDYLDYERHLKMLEHKS